mmetsp:Transcript_46140/g.109654  ORF Transcript_46140/g.109654 Transcript_46140/m.109654 type:complete len:215 (-) Transcript_46140:247-891(-)
MADRSWPQLPSTTHLVVEGLQLSTEMRSFLVEELRAELLKSSVGFCFQGIGEAHRILLTQRCQVLLLSTHLGFLFFGLLSGTRLSGAHCALVAHGRHTCPQDGRLPGRPAQLEVHVHLTAVGVGAVGSGGRGDRGHLQVVHLLPVIVLRGEWDMLETVCLEGQVRLTDDLLRLAVLSAGIGHCLLQLTGAKLSSCTHLFLLKTSGRSIHAALHS